MNITLFRAKTYLILVLMSLLSGCATATHAQGTAVRPLSATDQVESLTKDEIRARVPVDSAIFEMNQKTARFGTQAFNLQEADSNRSNCFFRSCYGGLTIEQRQITEGVAEYIAPQGNFVPPYSALVRVTPWTSYAELTVFIAAILQARPLEIWLRIGEHLPHKILRSELTTRAQMSRSMWFKIRLQLNNICVYGASPLNQSAEILHQQSLSNHSEGDKAVNESHDSARNLLIEHGRWLEREGQYDPARYVQDALIKMYGWKELVEVFTSFMREFDYTERQIKIELSLEPNFPVFFLEGILSTLDEIRLTASLNDKHPIWIDDEYGLGQHVGTYRCQ